MPYPRSRKVADDTMHVVGVDVFLHRVLGGFAPVPVDSPGVGHLTAKCVGELKALAATDRRVEHQVLLRMADRYGTTPNSLSVMLHRARHSGAPRYWDV